MTADERRVLGHLLSAEFPGAYELRAQATSAAAVGRCDCGCPSVTLRVDRVVPAAALASRLVPVEGAVKTSAGDTCGEILLFADDGWLSYLEYVYYSDAPATWPALDLVEVVLRDR